MTSYALILASVAVLLNVTGCVPLAHSSLMAPPASGQLIDMETLKPIAHASVTRHIVAADKTSRTITDDTGSFSFPKRSKFFWLAGCRAASRIDYRVWTEDHTPFQTNLYGGGDFYRGTVPHDLGRIVLLRAQP